MTNTENIIIPFGKMGVSRVLKVSPLEMNDILSFWEKENIDEIVLIEKDIAPTSGKNQYLKNYYRDLNGTHFYGKLCGEPVVFVVGNGTDEKAVTALQAWKAFQANLNTKGYPPLSKMFGMLDKRFWRYFTRCVPTYLNWFNKKKKGSYIERAQKTDVSSAFGYELSKSLPTLEGAQAYAERVKPNKDYPFAFYKDGTISIWNEFDSADWDSALYDFDDCQRKRDFRFYKYDYPKNSNEPGTILCKKASLSLIYNVKDLYEKKSSDSTGLYKAILNLSIGMFWRCKKPDYAHLAAVVVARCVDRMLKAYHTIEQNGGIPLLIATDSIAWEGNPLALNYTTTKSLGAMVLEHDCCEMIIQGAKAYQIRDEDGTVTTKWSGVPTERTEAMDFGELPQNAVECDMYAYSPKEKRFVFSKCEEDEI